MQLLHHPDIHTPPNYPTDYKHIVLPFNSIQDPTDDRRRGESLSHTAASIGPCRPVRPPDIGAAEKDLGAVRKWRRIWLSVYPWAGDDQRDAVRVCVTTTSVVFVPLREEVVR